MKKYSLINNWNIYNYDLQKYKDSKIFDNNKIVQSLWIVKN